MALCCMYTANFVTNRIQKQRAIYTIIITELYTYTYPWKLFPWQKLYFKTKYRKS